jgi:hypothetical protein
MFKGQGQYSIIENMEKTPLSLTVDEVSIQTVTDKINTYNFSGNVDLSQIKYLEELKINDEIYQTISYNISDKTATITLSKEININLDENTKYQVTFTGFNTNNWTKADYSHVEGSENSIEAEKAKYIHVEGQGHEITLGKLRCCHIEGEYSNVNKPQYIHVVGNGTKNENGEITRSNAYTLNRDGDAWFAGNVSVGESVETLATEDFVVNYTPLTKGERDNSV